MRKLMLAWRDKLNNRYDNMYLPQSITNRRWEKDPRSTTEGTGRKIGLEIEPISFNPTNVSALKKFTDWKYICMRRNSALSPSAGRYLHSLFPTSTVGHPGLFRFSLKRKKRTFTLNKTKQNKEKQRNVTQGNTKNIKSKCSCGRRG